MVTYSLRQTPDGLWNVCRAGFALFSDLALAAAIRLAREVARDEHLRSGRPVCVEMPGMGSSIRLARFALVPAALDKAA